MGRVEVENDRHETALAINPLLDRNQLVASDPVQAAVFSWHPCSLLSVTAVCSNNAATSLVGFRGIASIAS